MVALQTMQQSNARLASFPKGLVAVFIGATSGIGRRTLEHFAQHASSPRIYTVARPQSAASHETFLASLRKSNPSGTYTLIKGDHALVSDIDKAVDIVKQKETKLDLLVMSAGFMAFEGREDTIEGLDPSMSTRYYARLRAVQQLLPLLNSPDAPSPRVFSVLAAGMEAPINEDDLDLRNPANWTHWNASVHTATMGTLAFEQLASENPRLSFVHWMPGPVATPGLARIQKFGMNVQSEMSEEESGERGLFVATNDRYAVSKGLVPVPEGLDPAKKSRGGIFLVNPQGESIDNESVLTDMRSRGLNQAVWQFTQKIFADSISKTSGSKTEL